MKRFFLALALLCIIAPVFKRATDGFAVAKVSTLLMEDSVSAVDEQLLQPYYYYLGKGGQSYVFVSSDGKFVLKLFRNSRLKTLETLYKCFPHASLLEKIAFQRKNIEETLQSYAIAYRDLKEESGLVSVHLDASSPLTQPLKIVDKGRVAHIMDANTHPFIIQKKAVLVKEKIAHLMNTNDLQGAQKVITSLFSLLEKCIEKGIEDGDPNLSKNFGFCGDQPIQIDGGRLSLNHTPSVEKIAASKEDLEHWINQYFPELSADFKEAYEEFLHHAL